MVRTPRAYHNRWKRTASFETRQTTARFWHFFILRSASFSPHAADQCLPQTPQNGNEPLAPSVFAEPVSFFADFLCGSPTGVSTARSQTQKKTYRPRLFGNDTGHLRQDITPERSAFPHPFTCWSRNTRVHFLGDFPIRCRIHGCACSAIRPSLNNGHKNIAQYALSPRPVSRSPDPCHTWAVVDQKDPSTNPRAATQTPFEHLTVQLAPGHRRWICALSTAMTHPVSKQLGSGDSRPAATVSGIVSILFPIDLGDQFQLLVRVPHHRFPAPLNRPASPGEWFLSPGRRGTQRWYLSNVCY